MRVSAKLPDDLTIGEYARIVGAIEGICEGAAWLTPTTPRQAGRDVAIIRAAYGSPLSVVVSVTAIAGTMG